MLSISASVAWRSAYPGAVIGLLEVSAVSLPPSAEILDEQKREMERILRERYAGFGRPDFLALPVMSAYNRYYRRFNKTYHVLQQVESIVTKGKNLPSVSPLVDANFMIEVDTLVLTAGHDADKLRGAILMDVAVAGDEFIQMNGTQKEILAADMLMRDAHGVCCSILYGQDNLSPITPETVHALYVAYAPDGVPADQVKTHLQRIAQTIQSFSPSAIIEQLQLIPAA